MPATVVPMPDPADPTALPDPAPSPPAGYLDAVGGQPLLPVAQRAWTAAGTQAWSDPARLHHAGRRAGMVLDAARASMATSLGARPDEVYFTSSGPTAVGIAVQGLLEAAGGGRAVVTAVESMAVLSPAQRWAGEVDRVAVDGLGRVDVAALADAVRQPAALVCVQAANAEVGTRQPLAEAGRLARAAGVPLLVHAIQAIGHEPVPDEWDVLAASARDWGGPAGVGVLVVRLSARWTPEENPDRGWVGGFPDIPGAAAAAAALEYLLPGQAKESARLRLLVDRVRHDAPLRVPGLGVAGDPVDRLPHIVTLTCEGIRGEALVTALERHGVAIASGSACTADTRMSSHVLAAMGLRSDASVRVSLPLGCAESTIDLLLDSLAESVAEARGDLP